MIAVLPKNPLMKTRCFNK